MALLAAPAALAQEAPADNEEVEEAENETHEDPLAAFFREHEVYQGDDVLQRLARGRDAFRAGNYEQAAQAYRAAVALSEKHVIAQHMLGLAYYAKGTFAEAARTWRGALASFPDWARLDFKPVEEFGDHHEVFDQRRDELVQRLAQQENDDDAPGAAEEVEERFVLGYVLFFDGDYEAAMRRFQEVIERNSTDRAAQVFLDVLEEAGLSVSDEDMPEPIEIAATKRWLVPGLYELSREAFAEAALAFGEAGMRLNHGEPFAWMALALIGEGKPEHAARMLARGIRLGRTDLAEVPRPADLLGGAIVERRRESWSEEPVPAARRLLLGLLAWLEGEPGEAREHLEPLARPRRPAERGYEEAAVAMLRMLPDRDDPPPRIDLSRLAEELTREEADELAEDEREEDPPTVDRNDPPAGSDTQTEDDLSHLSLEELLDRIRTKTDQGDEALAHAEYERALEVYEEAYELGKRYDERFYDNPLRVDVFLKLARAHFGLGEFHTATEKLKRFLTVSPGAIRRQVGGFPAPFEAETLAEALRRLERTVRNEPEEAPPRFLLAYILFTQGKYAEAWTHFVLLELAGPESHPLVAFYVELLEEPPYEAHREGQEETAKRLLEAGRELLAEEEFERGEPLLRRAYEIDARASTVTALLAARWGMALATEQQEEATDDARVAAFRDIAQTLRSFLRELDEDAWSELALDFTEAFGSALAYERARESLDSHVKRRPLDFEANYVLGFVRYFAGEYDGALEAFENYRDAQPRGEPGDEFRFFRLAAARQSSN